jgi:hypothetical protein
MAHVTLIGNLRQFTGGVAALDVDAASVRQLFARLGEKFPELAPHLEKGSRSPSTGRSTRTPCFPGNRPRQRGALPAADRRGLMSLAMRQKIAGSPTGAPKPVWRKSKSHALMCLLDMPREHPAISAPETRGGADHAARRRQLFRGHIEIDRACGDVQADASRRSERGERDLRHSFRRDVQDAGSVAGAAHAGI